MPKNNSTLATQPNKSNVAKTILPFIRKNEFKLSFKQSRSNTFEARTHSLIRRWDLRAKPIKNTLHFDNYWLNCMTWFSSKRNWNRAIILITNSMKYDAFTAKV